MFIKATVRCTRNGCAQQFDYEFDAACVSASIGDGGSIEFSWPEPENPPEGWKSVRFLPGAYTCPEHSR